MKKKYSFERWMILWKSLRPQLFTTIVIWQGMIGEEKTNGPCVSDD